MYSPVHATAGVLLAAAIPNPALGLVAAFSSHYLLDAIPHGDEHVGPWMTGANAASRVAAVETADLGLAALMTAALVATFPQHTAGYLVAGAIVAILPDLLWGGAFLLEQVAGLKKVKTALSWHGRWHTWIHARPSYDVPFGVGLGYQILVLFIVLWFRG